MLADILLLSNHKTGGTHRKEIFFRCLGTDKKDEKLPIIEGSRQGQGTTRSRLEIGEDEDFGFLNYF